MNAKILSYLMEHPESRKRAIAAHLKIWQCDTDFLTAMHELEVAAIIKSTYYKDPANMEFYETFSIEASAMKVVEWYLTRNF